MAIRERIKRRIKKFSSTALHVIPNGEAVRETILNEGMKATEAQAFFWGNVTATIQDTGKGSLAVHSGQRFARSGFKSAMDFRRGDPVCGSLCAVSSLCEVVSGIVVWVPFPRKICTLSGLKAVSIGCETIRDMCAADPSNPLCK
jgi:hypothetical protein